MAENIVIRERQEMIALGSIPIGHGLREVVPIRPQCVGMEVALPPAKFVGDSDPATEGDEQENSDQEMHGAKATRTSFRRQAIVPSGGALRS